MMQIGRRQRQKWCKEEEDDVRNIKKKGRTQRWK